MRSAWRAALSRFHLLPLTFFDCRSYERPAVPKSVLFVYPFIDVTFYFVTVPPEYFEPSHIMPYVDPASDRRCYPGACLRRWINISSNSSRVCTFSDIYILFLISPTSVDPSSRTNICDYVYRLFMAEYITGMLSMTWMFFCLRSTHFESQSISSGQNVPVTVNSEILIFGYMVSSSSMCLLRVLIVPLSESCDTWTTNSRFVCSFSLQLHDSNTKRQKVTSRQAFSENNFATPVLRCAVESRNEAGKK